jgi:phosphopentomutase
LRVPTLASLGLAFAAEYSTGRSLPGVARALAADASAGCAHETSHGKDTLMGHWEIAGAPLDGPLGHLPRSGPTFPEDLVHEITRRAAVPGLIGLRHGDGLAMIEDLGEEHVVTGKPIVYTSADSVIQIAAHEETFGRERLYSLCELTRELTNPMRIGRIIARPFTGSHAGAFRRTSHRRDYPLPPAQRQCA